MKELKIITLESIDGIGISTQLRFLEQQLTDSNYKIRFFKFTDIGKAMSQIQQIHEFLYETPEGIVLIDGSFAKAIVHDMLSGYSMSKLEDRYRDILHEYECLNHNYELLNLVLLPENAEIGQKRKLRNAEVLGKKYEVTQDLVRQRDMLKLLGELDGYSITRSIKFNTLDIFENDKILDINQYIWDILKQYDIKKPS